MKNNFPEHLTQTMTQGIEGFNLCTFLIGLEGWRRGLTLRYHVDIRNLTDFSLEHIHVKDFGRILSLSNEERTHLFYQSRGDTTTKMAVDIGRDKYRTKFYLQKNNIPTLPSLRFRNQDSYSKIINMANQIGYPVTLKPTKGSLSRGVVINIPNEQQLETALNKIRDEQRYKDILLEKYFEGQDIRLYVVNKKVVAALHRSPSRIVGDGVSSIIELIDAKNNSRKSNPYLNARPIEIDAETKEILKEQGYYYYSVLEKSKTVLVKNKSTLTNGVDLYDITDEVTDHIKKIAIGSIDAIPGMVHGSVDMLCNNQEAYVLEVNVSANISMHMFPTTGQPRNVPASLIDYYFPGTLENRNSHLNMYFNYLDLVETLKKNYTNFVEVKSVGQSPITAKKILLKGENLNQKYINYIWGKAITIDINGYLKSIDGNTIEIIIASEKKEKLIGFKNLLKQQTSIFQAKIESVRVFKWNKEVNIGFFIDSMSDGRRHP